MKPADPGAWMDAYLSERTYEAREESQAILRAAENRIKAEREKP